MGQSWKLGSSCDTPWAADTLHHQGSGWESRTASRYPQQGGWLAQQLQASDATRGPPVGTGWLSPQAELPGTSNHLQETSKAQVLLGDKRASSSSGQEGSPGTGALRHCQPHSPLPLRARSTYMSTPPPPSLHQHCKQPPQKSSETQQPRASVRLKTPGCKGTGQPGPLPLAGWHMPGYDEQGHWHGADLRPILGPASTTSSPSTTPSHATFLPHHL